MKIAYLITAHSCPDHFTRLVRQLDTEDSVFFIHIDSKSNIGPFKKVSEYVNKNKLVWINRRSIVWSGFNFVRTTLDGFRLIASKYPQVEYISLISGQHYPIKPVAELHSFLRSNTRKSYIEFSPMPRPGWASGGMDRIGYYHFIFNKFRVALPLVSYLKVKLPYIAPSRFVFLKKVVPWIPSVKKFPRKYLDNCTPFEGSNWFTLNINLVKAILQYLEKDNSFYNFYKYTHCSDEMFFQSLIMNKLPEHHPNLVNNNLSYIQWDPLTGRPYTLDETFRDSILDSPAFLARKFESGKSKMLLDTLDNTVLKPV